MIEEVLGNRYKLVRELGAGGMAWVYLAEDLLDNTLVAVKVLYPQFNRDMSYVERFLREAKLALQIPSEHVVRILDYGADRDVYYLVMEQIQGEELATLLQERGKLPWKEALEIAVQVVLALEAANAQGVVHRDIKPQNIMITPQSSVKVLDFGIARARELPSLTQTGFIGSPYYISPEQAMGKHVDVRSDIYSLGIVLYEALSGDLPFDAETPWSIISQHIAQEPPKLNLEDSGSPPAVEALINKMLAKDPDDRYQTPGELLAAIEQVLRGPIEAPHRPAQETEPAHGVAYHERARQLLLSSLYERAMEAAQSEEWPQAVNLFNQVIKVDPQYQGAAERLAEAGLQARLAALYAAAQDALQAERWQEAVDELSEIVSVDADYREAADLLTQAGMSLAEVKARERLANLYQEGLTHYQSREWQEAEACFAQIVQADPDYQDASRLYADARRRARWSRSILARASRSLTSWLGRSTREEPNSEYTVSSPPETIQAREAHERDNSTEA